MKKKRILVFIMGKWSHSNTAIVEALQDKLPQHDIRVVDLMQQFKRDKRSLLVALLDLPVLIWQAFSDRGFDKSNLLYAPATSRFITGLAKRLTLEFRPCFTLQTTTRFNASTGLVPHFTVIDMTVAAARQGYRDLFNSSEGALDRLDAFQQRVYSGSDGVFAMGRYVRDSLVLDYHVAPRRAITLGAGPNIRLGPRSSITGSQNILFVGTDWARKGGPTLLTAFRQVRRKNSQATLSIVGCRPRINALGNPGINIIGRVAPEELHAHFTAARVFALPTVHEAFGIAFVEALHFGLPIVATDINAIPSMVEDGVNGYTIKPGDAKGLADALNRILDSDEIALSLGSASHERSRHFTWDHVGDVLSSNILQLTSADRNASQSGNRDQLPAERPRRRLRGFTAAAIHPKSRLALHSMQARFAKLLRHF